MIARTAFTLHAARFHPSDPPARPLPPRARSKCLLSGSSLQRNRSDLRHLSLLRHLPTLRGLMLSGPFCPLLPSSRNRDPRLPRETPPCFHGPCRAAEVPFYRRQDPEALLIVP